MTFATFQQRPRHPSVQQAAQAALAFVRNDKTILTLSGPNGAGKSHLALAIANEVAQEGKTPVVWLVTLLLDAIRRTFNDASAPDVFTPALSADLLVLDDMGAEKTSDWVDERLFTLLHVRYTEGRKTVITTNLKPDSGFSPRIADRLLDVHRCQVVAVAANSYRRER